MTLIDLRNKIDFDFDKFFMQYVLWWLSQTDNKTGQWVQAVSASTPTIDPAYTPASQAIAADKVSRLLRPCAADL